MKTPQTKPTPGAQAGLTANKAVWSSIRAIGSAAINTRHFVQALFTGKVPS